MIKLFYILEKFDIAGYRDFDNKLSIDGYIKIQPDYYAIAITLNNRHYYVLNSDCIVDNEEIVRVVSNFSSSKLAIVKPKDLGNLPVTNEGKEIYIINTDGIFDRNLTWYAVVGVSDSS